MLKSILSVFFTCLFAVSAFAEAVPRGSGLDSRVRITPHVDGQVFVVRTSTTHATTVEFERGEQIVSIVAGDTASFDFQAVPGDRVFAVKPITRGVHTNAIVYTNKRSYYFNLTEGNNPFYVVRFTYPERATRNSRNTPVRTARNQNYGASDTSEIAPIEMWDDGAFTYFRFAPNAPIPSIFRVTRGRERSVNSQTIENRLVRVSGTSAQWALRLGETEICIVELFNE